MRAKKHKQQEFVKLCSVLLRQGFNFELKDKWILSFDNYDFKRLTNNFTKLPFVNSICLISHNKNENIVYFNQWSDKHLNN